MKAIVQDRYGSPRALSLAEVEAPRVGDHDVLIDVRAAAVTHADRRLRSGDYPGVVWLPARLAMGFTGPRNRPGTMFAGRVAAVGAAVTRLRVGDDVFGSLLQEGGAYAEQLVVPEDGRLARTPGGLSYAQAAALPYGAITALLFLRDLAEVKPGDRVYILGASGGVGALAVQVARHLGAEVTGACSARHIDRVLALGAHRAVDYRAQARDEGPYDVILDTVGATTFQAARRSLTPRGRYLSLVVTARLIWDVIVTSIRGGQRALTSSAPGTAAHLDDVRALVEQGALRPVVDRSFPMEQAAEAHAWQEGGRAEGTVILNIGAPTAERAA
ncbi:MAG TPA: NAD(P)-dependent alcohol dehydrogenase [Myxococcota bacterium]|nr:NAD(P)-dependent alcohol dehydrogenase [Myxococcota bacterium]